MMIWFALRSSPKRILVTTQGYRTVWYGRLAVECKLIDSIELIVSRSMSHEWCSLTSLVSLFVLISIALSCSFPIRSPPRSISRRSVVASSSPVQPALVESPSSPAQPLLVESPSSPALLLHENSTSTPPPPFHGGSRNYENTAPTATTTAASSSTAAADVVTMAAPADGTIAMGSETRVDSDSRPSLPQSHKDYLAAFGSASFVVSDAMDGARTSLHCRRVAVAAVVRVQRRTGKDDDAWFIHSVKRDERRRVEDGGGGVAPLHDGRIHLMYDSGSALVWHNETFALLPYLVHRDSVVLASGSELPESDECEERLVAIRVDGETGQLDRRAFWRFDGILGGAKHPTSMTTTAAVSLAAMEDQLKGWYDDNIICTAEGINAALVQNENELPLRRRPSAFQDIYRPLPLPPHASAEYAASKLLPPAWLLPRAALHTVVFWENAGRISSRASYLSTILKYAHAYPMTTDLFVHMNRAPRLTREDLNERLVTRFNVTLSDSAGEEAFMAAHARLGVVSPFSDDASLGCFALQSLFGSLLEHSDQQPNATRCQGFRFSNRVRVTLVLHDLRERPEWLAWKPRSLMRSQFLLYDIVGHLEDDIGITPRNMDYYCRYKNAARDARYYLAFFRVEFGAGRKSKILSDVLRSQRISTHSRPVRLPGHDQVFAECEIQTYFAFWLADRQDLKILRMKSNFTKSVTADHREPLVLESASCLGGPQMLNEVYFTRKIVPVDMTRGMLAASAQVHHMTNAYANKGMAKFSVAAKITFR